MLKQMKISISIRLTFMESAVNPDNMKFLVPTDSGENGEDTKGNDAYVGDNSSISYSSSSDIRTEESVVFLNILNNNGNIDRSDQDSSTVIMEPISPRDKRNSMKTPRHNVPNGVIHKSSCCLLL